MQNFVSFFIIFGLSQALFAENKLSTNKNQVKKKGSIILFDVDGTLTEPRLKIKQDMRDLLKELRKIHTVGIVGGSDLVKQREQLGDDLLNEFDYVFAENGLVAYKDGKLFSESSIKDKLSEAELKQFINFSLEYISKLDIPIKRGTFVEFRKGMINISPIGRNCSQQERIDFFKLDAEEHIREKMITALKEKFPKLELSYSIGGQISFDVFPLGFDKTYCLQFIQNQFENIYFFGDKTYQGGNDFEIFQSPLTKSFSTTGPEQTIQMIKDMYMTAK